MNEDERSSDWFSSYDDAFESARRLALEHDVVVALERLDGRFGRGSTTTKWRLNYTIKRDPKQFVDNEQSDIYWDHWLAVDTEIECCPEYYVRPLKHDPLSPKPEQVFVRFFRGFREALGSAKATSRQLGTHVQIERDGEDLWYISWMQEITGCGETDETPPVGYFSWDHYYDAMEDDGS